MQRLNSEIKIAAEPQSVWKVLTDLESYQEWNSQLRMLKGKVYEGAQLKISIKPQYLEYIKRYGMPDDWQFDSEKLAIVMKDLISAGVISEPEVTETCTTESDQTPDSTSDPTPSTDSDSNSTSNCNSLSKYLSWFS